MEESEEAHLKDDTGERTAAHDELVYQQVGPPWLLYKQKTNIDSLVYAPPFCAVGVKSQRGQISAELQTKLIHSSFQRTHRTQARWYYPLDFPSDEGGNSTEKKKQKKRKRNNEQQQQKEYHYAVRPKLLRRARDLNALDPFLNEEESFLDTRVLDCVEQARKAMIFSHTEDDNNPCRMGRDSQKPPDATKQNRRRLLKQHKKYDHSYIPAKWKLNHNKSKLEAPKFHLNDDRCSGPLFFSQQRRNLADPSYLAPFPMYSIQKVIEADMPTKEKQRRKSEEEETTTEEYDARETTQHRQDTPRNRSSHNETGDPMEYGNCIACVPCSCPACFSNADKEEVHPNWCLLHPIGDSMDTLAASLVVAPNGIPSAALLRTRRNVALQKMSHRQLSFTTTISLGDGIRQIEQCTHNGSVFLARTSIHVSIITVKAREDDSLPLHKEKYNQGSKAPSNGNCWGTFELTVLQRVDLRSLSRHKPSYFPIHVTGHRNFNGSILTSQYKFAVLLHTKHGKERNIVHHFLWSPEGRLQGKNCYTKHVVKNVKAISQICFTAKHPMMMWATAEAFVKPNLAPDRAVRYGDLKPRFSRGHSLYTIDLRTNTATFQWSPSSDEFLTEGTHSISGIAAGLGCDDTSRLWVSSISAQKIWELDASLLPLRVIKYWTLPNQCANNGPCLAASGGLYGAGHVLMSQMPQPKGEAESPKPMPLLCVGVGAGAFGVHLYNTNSAASMSQADTLECAASSALASWKEHRLATCSIFGSGDFLGVAPICFPLMAFSSSPRDRLAQATVICCVLTLGPGGDIYSHTLLGSQEKHSSNETAPRYRHAFPSIVNEIAKTVGRIERKLVGGMTIVLGATTPSSFQLEDASDKPGSQLVDVRPFKRCDLRTIQTESQSTSQSTKDSRGGACSIEPTITNGATSVLPSGLHRWVSSSVKEPPKRNLIYPGQYLNGRQMSQAEQATDRESEERSDVTEQVLDLVLRSG